MANEANTEASGTTTEESAKTTETATGNTTPDVKSETSTEKKEGQQTNEKTFTQADVDRIIADRLKREKADAQKKLDEEQGKFKDLYEKEKADRAREKQERDEADKTAKINAAIERVAADAKTGAREPKALPALFDRSKITLDGDAVKGVEAELERLKKEMPGLFAGPGKADGGKTVSSAAGGDEALTPRERMRAAYATK